MTMNGLPEQFEALRFATTPDKTYAYGLLTEDLNPIHVDSEMAARSPLGTTVTHGTMAVNLILASVRRGLPPGWRIRDFDIRFQKPVPVGSELTTEAIFQHREDGSAEYRIAALTQAGTTVMAGHLTVVRKL